MAHIIPIFYPYIIGEQVFTQTHIGSAVAQCLTWDRGIAGSSLTSVNVLCPWARCIDPGLLLVQPRKTRPNITEKLLTGT